MKSEFPFYKLQGAGNDFILIDNRLNDFSGVEESVFKNLCNRRFGIGADGLILIDFHEPSFFFLKYFNSDGRPGEMCGNGARCAVYFMHLLHSAYKKFGFEISQKFYRGEVTGKNQVKIIWSFRPELKTIDESELNIPVEFDSALLVNSGVPHFILDLKDELDSFNVKKWGSYFRNHEFFSPKGANVNFLKFLGNKIYIRTFERGIEGETLACGTGAVAAAIAGKYWNKINFPVEIVARGGILKIGVDDKEETLWMEGPVRKVFTGVLNLKDYE